MIRVPCEHAVDIGRPGTVRCALGRFGGLPHVSVCRACRQRGPRGLRSTPASARVRRTPQPDQSVRAQFARAAAAIRAAADPEALERLTLTEGFIAQLDAVGRPCKADAHCRTLIDWWTRRSGLASRLVNAGSPRSETRALTVKLERCISPDDYPELITAGKPATTSSLLLRPMFERVFSAPSLEMRNNPQ